MTTPPSTDRPEAPAPPNGLSAVWWALIGAAWTGGVWATALVFGFAYFGVSFRADATTDPLPWALGLGGAGAVLGLSVGVLVGRAAGGPRRFTFAARLGALGALGGTVGGGLTAHAVVLSTGLLHPLVSSTLVWALAGLLVGAIGRAWARRPGVPTCAGQDVLAPHQPGGLTRRNAPRPLFRAAPVLAASALAFAGALVVPPGQTAGLVAVGVLGLTVAVALRGQERRLQDLNARLRELERRALNERERDER
ncbi:hypothetical protein R5W24_006029 [Gemmata sp. JC717]|uniref:hypothetical protein n=1 Tax=Gemmata algarum TaxID=2975278 RepID=UPI0021BAC5E0|nr:hypothetical protein [Gemmata algarum]MDY3556856.1 hypothetical protein [Gemmata algarum]